MQRSKLAQELGGANLDLQLKEWVFEESFAGVVINDVTGEMLEYRHFVKHPKYKDVWETSLANKFGHLAQGICNIP